MVECWSCSTPNLPSRTFCVECGTFIGSSASASSSPGIGPIAAAAFASPSIGPDTDSFRASPAGTMALGSYAVSMRRAEERGRRRRLLASAAVVLIVALVGAAGLQVATGPGRGGGGSAPGPVAAVVGQPGSTTDGPGAGVGPGDALADRPGAGTADEPGPPAAAPPEKGTVATPQDAETTPQDAETTPQDAEAAGTGDTTNEETTTTAGTASPAADGTPSASTDEVERAAAADTTPSIRRDRSGTGTGTTDPLIRNGWVCDGRVSLEDDRPRTWSLGRATFRERSGYERVVLHLKRMGSGSAGPASVTAEAIPTSRVGRALPGVRRPSAGRTTVSLLLEDGIRGNLGVRGYRPSGLRQVREFSVYPAARGASRVLVSLASDACFRLRAPGWNDGSTASTARIIVDIRS